MVDVPLRQGARFSFKLTGQHGHYDMAAVVISSTESELQLRTDQGRTHTVPRSAVRSAEPIDDRLPPRSQTSLAKELKETLDAASSEGTTIDQIARIRIVIEGLLPLVTGLNQRLAVSAVESTKHLHLSLSSPDPEEAGKARASVVTAAKTVRGIKSRHGSLTEQLTRTPRVLLDLESMDRPGSTSVVQGVPQVLTQDRINVTRGANAEFDLSIRVSLDRDSIDIRDIELHLDKFRSLKIIGSASRIKLLKAGHATAIKVRMRDARKQGSRADISIEVHLTYRASGNEMRRSPRQTLRVRVQGMENHDPIPNPFRSYAGGLPVESPKMFFGRKALVAEFADGLSDPKGGMCYALYGQQRTGKSSALEQVKARLMERGAVVASMSMGTVDRHAMTLDFIEEVLSQFRAQVDGMLPAELSSPLLSRWPDQAAIERRPLRSFQRARQAAGQILKSAGRPGVPFVVVVDEFTYLHEILRRQGVNPSEHNELRDFMRQLKGLLEGRMFSALLVGQDTMPRFLDSYPNEFSVMSTRKLDYLTPEETQMLADEPVRLPDGASRYTGYALNTIATYTDGHPFFTQILCDRIISLANAGRHSDITESDVSDAVESLIWGRDAIEAHRFDCLVTADNTHALTTGLSAETDLDQSVATQALLTKIAIMAGSQNQPVATDSLQLGKQDQDALADLILRGVLRQNDRGVSIRVVLYSDYLRRRLS